jgi:hypothetical protein
MFGSELPWSFTGAERKAKSKQKAHYSRIFINKQQKISSSLHKNPLVLSRANLPSRNIFFTRSRGFAERVRARVLT